MSAKKMNLEKLEELKKITINFILAVLNNSTEKDSIIKIMGTSQEGAKYFIDSTTPIVERVSGFLQFGMVYTCYESREAFADGYNFIKLCRNSFGINPCWTHDACGVMFE